jgi:hypothetical protein
MESPARDRLWMAADKDPQYYNDYNVEPCETIYIACKEEIREKNGRERNETKGTVFVHQGLGITIIYAIDIPSKIVVS